MSRGNGSSVISVALILAILLIAVPVSAENNTTQTTTSIPTSAVTTLQTTNATPAVTTTQTATATPTPTVTTVITTVATTQATASPTATTVAVTPPPAVVVTATPTIWVTEPPTTGSLVVYSSPPGASILIDGIYYGATPDTVTGVPEGNHILRLSLSGYYDYEGSIYVGAGRTEQGYGTLQPMNPVVSAAPTTVQTVFVPVIVPVVTATNASDADPGLFGNSGVVAAIIGAIAVIIGSAATIFTHVKPPKKE
jgi:PEGA domain